MEKYYRVEINRHTGVSKYLECTRTRSNDVGELFYGFNTVFTYGFDPNKTLENLREKHLANLQKEIVKREAEIVSITNEMIKTREKEINNNYLQDTPLNYQCMS